MSYFRRIRTVFLAGLALAAGLGVSTSAYAEPTRIRALQLSESEHTRVAVEVDRRVEHSAFFLDEPMRLVVDLLDTAWDLQSPPNPGGLVAGWRFGRRDAQTSRLVIDLSGPVRLRRLGYELSANPRQRAQLFLELEPVNREVFAANAQPWVSSTTLLRSVYVPPEPRPLAAVIPAQAPTPRQAAAPAPAPTLPPPARPSDMTAGGSGGSNATSPPEIAPGGSPLAQASPPSQVATAPRAGGQGSRPGRRAERYVIVIDPGHGGSDPGAVGRSGTFEKDITLTVSRDIRRHLEATGRYRVHLTREKDEFVRLRERVNRARAVGADMFISVHADSIGIGALRGASVYTLSDTASDAEAAALAARENRADIIAGVDLSNESKDVATILIDLAQRETQNRSASLAHTMVRELGREVRLLPAKPHRFAGFAVLKAPDVPSVLLELGYLSNRHEEAMLKQPQHRNKIATGVARAVDAFFGFRGGRRS